MNSKVKHLLSTIVVVVSACFLLSSSMVMVWSKEIEATKEWQIIGENDTVPAGAHIRMDMTTGEKWIKLLDEDDDDASKVASVEVEADGSTTAIVVDNKSKETSSSSDNNNYDYDMMYRTLSKLPKEEQDRMGGLPELPPNGTSKETISSKDRIQFEKRLKEIWERRQEELALWQEDAVADLPGILMDRIKRLKAYLEDPYMHLVELSQQQQDDQFEEEEEGVVTHIVSVLQDLEGHLADVDMTRDFHTLGGWTPLVSLLSNEVHYSDNNNNSRQRNDTVIVLSDDEIKKWIDKIQQNAAWVIGTAIKNTGEFFPYAIESVFVNGDTTSSALQLLLFQFDVEDASASQQKHQKVVYALGALLRGNHQAQNVFLELEGPKHLASALELYYNESKDNIITAKLVKRILALLSDIIVDNTTTEVNDEEKTSAKIIDAIASPSVCQSSLKSLKHDNDDNASMLRETAVRTFNTLVPYCINKWDVNKAFRSALFIQKQWRTSPNLDEDVRRDLLELIESILRKLDEQQKQQFQKKFGS